MAALKTSTRASSPSRRNFGPRRIILSIEEEGSGAGRLTERSHLPMVSSFKERDSGEATCPEHEAWKHSCSLSSFQARRSQGSEGSGAEERLSGTSGPQRCLSPYVATSGFVTKEQYINGDAFLLVIAMHLVCVKR